MRIFLGARRRGWCEGLFITTGIPARPVKVVDDLIKVLELLRGRHHFGGYVHVKLVAGAEAAQVEQRLTALGEPGVPQSGGALSDKSQRHRPGQEPGRYHRRSERVRTLVLHERSERADGKPRDPLRPGGAPG